MEQFNFKGTGVALITPFNKDETIDWEAFKAIIDHCIDGGLDYLVLQGTTGESPSITQAEREELIVFTAKYVAKRCPLVLGLGGNSTYQVVYALQHTNLQGYQAILSVCPYYNKPNQMGIIAHYQQVADNSPLPIILYNVPGRTGVNMTSETQLILAKHPNIIATKEASGDIEQMMSIIKNKPLNFELISGDDSLTFPILCVGGIGVISVIAQLIPKHFSNMVRLSLAGKVTEASILHYGSLDLCRAIFKDGSPGGIKHLLHQAGFCQTTLRLPLVNINNSTADLLAETWLDFNKKF